MKARVRMIVALVVMVLVPLVLLTLAAARLVAREERLVRQSFAELALAQLQDLRQGLVSVVEERERRALAAAGELREHGAEAAALRRFVRREPLFRAAFLLDVRGRLLFPPPTPERTAEEAAFLLRARAVVDDPGALLATAAADVADEARGPLGRQAALSRREVASSPHGWRVWYDADDLDLLAWQRLPDGRLLGVEVDRARLLADVIVRLPDDAGPERLFVLRDARGEVLHQWGGYAPPAAAPPLATLSLDAPLASWQLAVYAPASALGRLRSGLWSGLGLGLVGLGLALSGLAVFLYREHARGLRVAEQRVSFVNRVSHELKTPLTNIRLYAELLQGRLDDEDEVARRQLDVVVAEGQRLGRLIDNVLTFGRHQRGSLRLRLARGSVDEVLARVAERWRSVLAAKGLRLVLVPGAADEVQLDADALTQILDNLLGNVEKYAAAGGLVTLTTSRAGDRTTVRVEDRGPGIPAEARERIFEPFQRLTDATSEGVSGTGLGLAVVRELARQHGGDVSVRDAEPGALFEVTLRTPSAGAGGGRG